MRLLWLALLALACKPSPEQAAKEPTTAAPPPTAVPVASAPAPSTAPAASAPAPTAPAATASAPTAPAASAPLSINCRTDADCRAFSDYCKGCHCRALSVTEPDPVCSGPGARCLVDPCKNVQVGCSQGRCVAGGSAHQSK